MLKVKMYELEMIKSRWMKNIYNDEYAIYKIEIKYFNKRNLREEVLPFILGAENRVSCSCGVWPTSPKLYVKRLMMSDYSKREPSSW